MTKMLTDENEPDRWTWADYVRTQTELNTRIATLFRKALSLGRR